MMVSQKRKSPSDIERKRRQETIKNRADSGVIENIKYGFLPGNNKTGVRGGIAGVVYVWNMPYIRTCPGASDLCKQVCYNAAYEHDTNSAANLTAFMDKREELMGHINNSLSHASKEGQVFVRLHSEGDFFSEEYIRFWMDIVRDNPDVLFWAYTKSWRLPRLRNELMKLEELENINIYFSWDKTMGEKPIHKVAVLCESIEKYSNDDKRNLVVCPEQYRMVEGCADCGICTRNKKSDIIFAIH